MINNDLGEVKVSKDVISKIITLAMGEIEGVTNFSNNGTKLLRTKMPKIKVEQKDVSIIVYISLLYGLDIKKKVEEVQENIKLSIENMLGLNVKSIDVCVYELTDKED